MMICIHTDKKHLPFLFRTLHVLADRWIGFCLQLGVQDTDEINRDVKTADYCLALGLQSWLQGESVSWKRLIEAIYQPAGGGHQRLAGEVAESFRGMIHQLMHIIALLRIPFPFFLTEMCIFKPIMQARATSTANICNTLCTMHGLSIT